MAARLATSLQFLQTASDTAARFMHSVTHNARARRSNSVRSGITREPSIVLHHREVRPIDDGRWCVVGV
jgi:hypothetical protein